MHEILGISELFYLAYKSLVKVVLTPRLVSEKMCKPLVFKYVFVFTTRLLIIKLFKFKVVKGLFGCIILSNNVHLRTSYLWTCIGLFIYLSIYSSKQYLVIRWKWLQYRETITRWTGRERFACAFLLDSDVSNELVYVCEKITLSVLDEICSVKTKERVLKPKVTWYDDNIHVKKRVQWRLERQWRETRAEDHEKFLTHKNSVTQMINDAEIDYFSDKFSTRNVKDMYATINSLLNTAPWVLPVCESVSDHKLANNFLSFSWIRLKK